MSSGVVDVFCHTIILRHPKNVSVTQTFRKTSFNIALKNYILLVGLCMCACVRRRPEDFWEVAFSVSPGDWAWVTSPAWGQALSPRSHLTGPHMVLLDYNYPTVAANPSCNSSTNWTSSSLCMHMKNNASRTSSVCSLGHWWDSGNVSVYKRGKCSTGVETPKLGWQPFHQ